MVEPKKRAKVTPRRVSEENVLEILRLVLAHPEWSSQKVSLSLPRIDDKPAVGNHGVQNVLFRLDLNTVEKRKNFVEKVKGLELKETLGFARGEIKVEEKVVRPAFKPRELNPGQRLEMIERVIKYGEPVAKVCRDFKVSRPVFYKWLKRYLSVPKGERVAVLQDKKPRVERYYRQTPEKYEEVVLSLIAQYPEFGVAKIVDALPIIAGKPLVGHHGVQNIFRRNDLNTYEKRLAYARSQITPVTRLISRFVELGTRFIVLPAPTRARIIRFASIAFSVTFLTIVVLGVVGYFVRITVVAPPVTRIGLFFATFALVVGSIFFAYSLKYYLTLALVLSFSRQPLEEGGGFGVGLNGRINGRKNGNGQPNGGWLQRIFGLRKSNGEMIPLRQAFRGQGGGLQPSLDHVKLKRYPFVSVHLPFYNEKKVAERILKACTSMDYPGDCYEVIVCDDSTDETTAIVRRFAQQWNKQINTNNTNLPAGKAGKPIIRILHRPTREGFKGGALKYAVDKMDPRTEFVVVFDADFIPYPDTLELFIKYFKVNNDSTENYTKSNIAVVGGYQWHVLNKSENWVTRGVRTEYAGSYVIERPGREILGLLKQISGAVYMIRADVLKKLGWGTSITEDFQLTLRLYEQGYKIVYTPYVQTPAECVSTINRLIRQRMRWAEGHSNNIRRMFIRLIFGYREKGRGWVSSPLTLAEKLELFYISPYYLQAFLFLVGTFSWLLAETVFPARLPFWTSLWGWSLVLTNFFSLPLVNAVGLFLEEAEEKDYLGLLSFIALSYILVPFQAYASVKGFLERQEGPWFRTPKTGRITDVFTRGRFYRWIAGILPGRARAPAIAPAPQSSLAPALVNPYVALATANNQFNNFRVKPRKMRWVGNFGVVSVSLLTIFMLIAAPFIPLMATPVTASPFAFKNTGKPVQAQEEVHQEEITAPLNQTYEGFPENLEYIFHPEPRVRAKEGYKEVEITVIGAEGLGHPDPDKAYKEGVVYTYQDIFEGIDLVWIAQNGRLEEHFVLHEYKEFNSLDERIRLTDLVMAKIGDEIQIASEEGGHPLFYFAKPYMYEENNPEMRGEGLEFKLEKEEFGYKLKKVLTPEGKAWLASPERVFPIIIDPTLVKSTVASAGATDDYDFGSVQRKIAYASSAWYVLYEPGDDINYSRCLQSTGCDEDGDWVAGGDIDDDGTADHGSSTFYYQSDNRLWVAWVDDKGGNPDDTFHYRYIDTTSAWGPGHTLGTHCESADLGAIDNTELAYIAAAGNGDLVFGYSSSAGGQADIWEAEDGACDFTNSIEAGSGLPTGNQTFAVAPVVLGNKVFIIYNDDGDNGDMRFSVYDTSDGSEAWSNVDTEVATNAYNVLTFSATSDGTDIWLLVLPDASTAPDFFRCNDCVNDLIFDDESDPFGTPSNAEDVSLTYNSNTDEIKAFILRDATQQVYGNTSDADTISWETEYSLGYTAQDMADLSSVYSVTSEDYMGVVVDFVASGDYEFSTVPESFIYFLVLAPLLPGILKKLRERRQVWKVA